MQPTCLIMTMGRVTFVCDPHDFTWTHARLAPAASRNDLTKERGPRAPTLRNFSRSLCHHVVLERPTMTRPSLVRVM